MQDANAYINSLDRAGDGSYLYTDGCRVRRIYRDDAGTWRVRTEAGTWPDCTGKRVPRGDGGPAVGAGTAFVAGVAAMPDGGFVFGDGKDGVRVRRVYPDGHIQTLAVIDQPYVVNNSSLIVAMSVDREGRVLWRSPCNIGRIDQDGRQTLLAGVGTEAGTTAEGALGTDTQACAGGAWSSVETGPDGAVYYDYGAQVRRIGDDGRVTTYAGVTSAAGVDNGDGGPARKARLWDTRGGIGFDPQGRLIVSVPTSGAGRIRRISAPLPSYQGPGSGYRLPSESGRQVYVFDATGRHLRTRDALTGATIWEFSYDAAGHLTGVDDRDGDRTSIQRDGDGTATAIQGPDGDRTLLSHSGENLTAVTNPASQTTALEYTTGGLLSAITGPRGNRFAFTYDSTGRLTKAEDPNDPDGPEGSVTLARSSSPTAAIVTATTALGRVTTHELLLPVNGTRTRRTTAPDGTVTTVEKGRDTQVVTTPDGTVRTLSHHEGRAPRRGPGRAHLPPRWAARDPGPGHVHHELRLRLRRPPDPADRRDGVGDGRRVRPGAPAFLDHAAGSRQRPMGARPRREWQHDLRDDPARPRAQLSRSGRTTTRARPPRRASAPEPPTARPPSPMTRTVRLRESTRRARLTWRSTTQQTGASRPSKPTVPAPPHRPTTTPAASTA